MLNITASAKKHLKSKCIENNKKYILLDLKPSGCAGFEYAWGYCDSPSVQYDRLIDDLIVVSYEAQSAVSGSTIDFNKELVGSYLTVENPNIQSACGCGVSFTL